MTDLIKDIIETSRERIKTPITAAFITAFLVYNWRPILYLLFSNALIETKINHINSTYCDFWAIVIPLIIALIYVGLVPYIMVGIEYCTKKAIEGRKTHKSKQILFDLKNEKEIASEEFQIEKIKTGHKEISELNNTIETLTLQIETLNIQNRSNIENYDSLLESSNTNEEKLENLVNKVNEDYDKERAKIKRLIELSGLEELLSLPLEERQYFIEFCDSVFFKKKAINWLTDEVVDKFERLELIAIIHLNKEYALLPLGRRFYDYFLEKQNTI